MQSEPIEQKKGKSANKATKETGIPRKALKTLMQ